MKFTRLLLAVAVLSVVGVISSAQNPNQRQNQSMPLLNMSRVLIKPDRVMEFRDLMKQYAGAAHKAAIRGQFRMTYRTTVGNSPEFWIMTPMSNYAERDEPLGAVAKTVSAQERAANRARLSQCIERVQDSIAQLSDLSLLGANSEAFPFIAVTVTRARPGGANQFADTWKNELRPVLKKLNANVSVYRTVWGGNTDDFTFGSRFDKWAELDQMNARIAEAAGGEKAAGQIFEKLGQLATIIDRYVLRYEPELSYYPAP